MQPGLLYKLCLCWNMFNNYALKKEKTKDEEKIINIIDNCINFILDINIIFI